MNFKKNKKTSDFIVVYFLTRAFLLVKYLKENHLLFYKYCKYPFMPAELKENLTILVFIFGPVCTFVKIFDGEIPIRNKSSTLLQILKDNTG